MWYGEGRGVPLCRAPRGSRSWHLGETENGSMEQVLGLEGKDGGGSENWGVETTGAKVEMSPNLFLHVSAVFLLKLKSDQVPELRNYFSHSAFPKGQIQAFTCISLESYLQNGTDKYMFNIEGLTLFLPILTFKRIDYCSRSINPGARQPGEDSRLCP